MNDKKLQDYLHYYMGCKFMTDNSEGEVNPETIRFIYPMIEKGYNVQLVLRKLEDLTDEEIKELIGWDKLNELYVDVNFECGNFGIVVNYSIDAEDQGVHQQSRNITFHTFSPKEWHYLLSKGFDLFGLIKSSEAVDEKTLNEHPGENSQDYDPPMCHWCNGTGENTSGTGSCRDCKGTGVQAKNRCKNNK